MGLRRLIWKGISISRVLWLIGKRRIEYRILFSIATARILEVEVLARMIGAQFGTVHNLCNGVGWVTALKPGHVLSKEGKASSICWEAPVGITIYHGTLELFGLGVELRGKALCIRQLQGVQGTIVPKELHRWPQLFAKTCQDFARKVRTIEEVRIYCADQSLFYDYPNIDCDDDAKWPQILKEHQQRMRRRYDGTARTLGFKQTHSRYYSWHKT